MRTFLKHPLAARVFWRAVETLLSASADQAIRDLTRAKYDALKADATVLTGSSVYAESGQIARAVEDFSKVLDRMPADLAARQGRGLALAAAGDHARAIQDFTRVLQREPRARVARAARAFSLFSTRQYPRAIADWDALLKDDPSQLAVVYCRGAAKVLSGDDTGRADMSGVRQQKPDVAAAQAVVCAVPAP
jgi:tetratricopeptide (TPR) repeat protein